MRSQPLLVHSTNAYIGPGSVSNAEVDDRVALLEQLDRFVRQRKEATRRDTDLYSAQVRPGVELWQALFEQGDVMSEDARAILAGVLDRAKELIPEDLADAPPLAQMGLWPKSPDHISIDAEWYRFRRAKLPACGVTAETFCKQAELIFPNLVFSSRFPHCLETMEGSFEAFLPKVIEALSMLNDKLVETIQGYEIVAGLKRFTAVSGFETTMEGNAERNGVLTFSFGVSNSKQLICSPHMKLSASPVAGDTKYYHNRIYFNSHQEGATAKIHVGHVGGHL